MTRAIAWMSLALAAVCMQGCVVSADRTYGRGDVLFTVEWTIDGVTDSRICREADVSYALVSIYDDRDVLITDYDVDCEDFGIDIELPPGRYWASVQLFDSRDRERTRPADTDIHDLVNYDSDFVVIDFPPDSFF